MIDLKPSSVTEAVNQLVARDLVSRDYDNAEDRRAVHVRLKKTGANLLEEADKALVALILDVWGPEYDTDTRRKIFEQSARSVISQGQVRVENRTIRADTAYIISVLIGYSNAVAHAHEFGLSLSQYRILLRLSEAGQALSCADVSRDLLMKSNAVSVACDALAEKELEAALEELKRIRKEDMPKQIVSESTLAYNIEWKDAIENYNLLDITELMVRATLERPESRGSYLRPDYPKPNDEWACSLAYRFDNGNFTSEKISWPQDGWDTIKYPSVS